MTRKATPDLLGDVSQETPRVDDVTLAMGDGGPQRMASSERMPQRVGVAFLQDNPYQPRQRYAGIEELAENIRLNGLLQAPVARHYGGSYQLAFGHRRLRAYRLLAEQHGGDWLRMPVVVLPLTDDEMARYAWSENHNREDVSAVEEARLFQRMIADFGFTQKQIADDVGKSRSAVANTLRLLQLPAAAQELVDSGAMTERHGRELLRLAAAPAWQEWYINELAGEIKQDGLRSVSMLARAITQWIRNNGQPLPATTVKMADRWNDQSNAEPAPWPLDGFAPRSPDVHGECAGCGFLVTFDREPAPRCTDRKCYGAKERLWKERDKERQKAAAVEAVARQFETADADVEPAEAVGGAAGDSSAGAVRWTRKDRYSTKVFGTADAPPALMERGLCGSEQCECFALMLAGEFDVQRSHLGPDREQAPNVVYVCENASRLRAQRNRLEEMDAPEKAAERKAAVAEKSAETRDAKAALRELWEEIGAGGLASSQTAMAIIAQAAKGYSYSGDEKLAGMSVGQLWDWLFWLVAEKSCKQAGYNDEGNRVESWVAAKAQRLAQTLRSELAPPSTNGHEYTNAAAGGGEDGE